MGQFKGALPPWLSLWTHNVEKRIGATPRQQNLVTDCFKELSNTSGQNPRNKLLRRAHLLTLLTLLSEYLGMSESALETAYIITPALDALFESRGRIDLATAAQLCGTSVSSFKRAFNQQMNISFGAFTLKYRIHGVCQELIRTQKPIKRIAADWGFVDSSHLHRHFKKTMQRTPLKYREAALALSNGAPLTL